MLPPEAAPGSMPPPAWEPPPLPREERKSSVALPPEEEEVALGALVLVVIVVLIVPLVPKLITGPNVCPASVLTLKTDSFVCGCIFSFASHHETHTILFSLASISAVCD